MFFPLHTTAAKVTCIHFTAKMQLLKGVLNKVAADGHDVCLLLVPVFHGKHFVRICFVGSHLVSFEVDHVGPFLSCDFFDW